MMKNYRTILPEHEALVAPVIQQRRDTKPDVIRVVVTALMFSIVVVVGISLSTYSAGARRGTSNQQAVIEEQEAKFLSSSVVPMESLDAQFDRLEEWKRHIHDSPVWNQTKTEWSDFKASLDKDDKNTQKKTREWWRNFREATAELWNDTNHKTANWVNEGEYKTSNWWSEEQRKQRDWWNRTSTKSGEWIDQDKHKTSDWWNHTEEDLDEKEHKSGEWWNKTTTKSGEWIDHTEEDLGEEEHKSAEWFNNTEHKTAGWISDEEHKSTEWFNNTEHKIGGWVSDEEHKSAEWFNNTEHKTGGWVSDEEQKSAEWFNNTEHRATDWFHHVNDGIKHKAEDTADWWNETEHKTGDWWYNVTHRHKDLPEFVIYMNTTEAYRMLAMGGVGFIDYAQDYFLIQQGYDAQMNQAYCPVATSAAILNSLRGHIELPMDPVYNPYPYATQPDMFNECTNAHVIQKNAHYDGIFASPGGLGMPQTKALLECHLHSNDWNVTAHHLDPYVISIHDFRRDLQEALANTKARVMINYDRKAAGQVGGGHWSPIGAFSPDMDAFLVMDVAKYKYPNAWISTSLLYKSLQTFDTCGNWDFPRAQDSLPPELLHSKTLFDHMSAMVMLGCESTRRGYITIEKIE